ncbi:MAG: bifunctional folylpolyglutamate synthase/dihydrofolate synthase [Prevotellaceae bacterium]|nr:bifunctional folylpolyglutamate synthase/dihydrofolate synthase [Prevotellaceae bacterium]
MDYKATIQYLYDTLPVFHRTGKSAYKANLDNSIALDNYFNNPHRRYRAIHVAGTNGKGSVSHILASVLQCAGYKTGLYTSPHLADFRERIKVNGQEISEQSVIDFVENNKPVIESLKPSFFEITSAMAFWFFADMQVDVAVIETGLGGRLDSTNIITPALSVITNIGFDHTEFLGNDLRSIAFEKAGIIKPEIPVIIGEKHDLTTDVFTEKAKATHSPIFFAEDCFEVLSVKKQPGKQVFTINALNHDLSLENKAEITIDLEGNYQQKNIITGLTAIAALKRQLFNIDREAELYGLEHVAQNTGLKGRWQVLRRRPTVVCDTGHNAHGLRYTMKQLEESEYENLFIVLGVVGDKDTESIIPLLPRNARYFFTRASIPRAMNAVELAAKCMASGLKGEIIPAVPEAVHKAITLASTNDMVFVGGSTFVVAEIPEI